MREVTFTMPWGEHTYRYRGKRLCGWPQEVEVKTDEGWEPCPNINVHMRIVRTCGI